MFTDLAGFTRLMEANAPRGRTGASLLLDLLNSYFSAMIETINSSGGFLLEFTGDALLGVFNGEDYSEATARAVRAGLRMQRAMTQFNNMVLNGEHFSLKMRVGIHSGRFLAANIGTPKRTEHVLLGIDVHKAKLAEGAGQVDRVNVTHRAYEHISDLFRFEPGKKSHKLVIDDFDSNDLGQYEFVSSGRRLSTPLWQQRESLAKRVARPGQQGFGGLGTTAHLARDLDDAHVAQVLAFEDFGVWRRQIVERREDGQAHLLAIGGQQRIALLARQQ
jgi:class 3 adenylate cyclase